MCLTSAFDPAVHRCAQLDGAGSHSHLGQRNAIPDRFSFPSPFVAEPLQPAPASASAAAAAAAARVALQPGAQPRPCPRGLPHPCRSRLCSGGWQHRCSGETTGSGPPGTGSRGGRCGSRGRPPQRWHLQCQRGRQQQGPAQRRAWGGRQGRRRRGRRSRGRGGGAGVAWRAAAGWPAATAAARPARHQPRHRSHAHRSRHHLPLWWVPCQRGAGPGTGTGSAGCRGHDLQHDCKPPVQGVRPVWTKARFCMIACLAVFAACGAA